MTQMVLALTALFGAAMGSFLNVVIHRLPRGESIVRPRSRCPGCQMQLGARDNVPLFSWLALRGKCRGCGEPISIRYPLVELTVAVAFVAVCLAVGPEPELLLWLPFTALLVAVAGIDLEHRIIPNKIVLPGMVYAVAVLAAVAPGRLPEHLIAGAAAFTFLLLAALAYPAGMGMGDVKLAGLMGLCLGLSVAPALLIAFMAGTVAGLAHIARGGQEARKRGIPFGPFLALGGLVGVLAGPELVALYADNFLA